MSITGISMQVRTQPIVSRVVASAVISCGLALAITVGAHAGAEPSSDSEQSQQAESRENTVNPRTFVTDPDNVERRWLMRLDDVDRQLLNAHIGYAPPALTDDLKWLNDAVGQWSDLRGRVVVVQSWTAGSRVGRAWPMRIAKALEQFPDDAVQFIALHTPQRAESAPRFLKRRSLDGARVVIDSSGKLCDAIGFYKFPANIVIGRNGMVRYAGLDDDGVAAAVKKLIDEPYVESFDPPKRDVPNTGELGYPPITGGVRSAKDVRGEQAPQLQVQQWLTERPNAQNKVVIVEFWATWCLPCVANIPHMNKLVKQFDEDVVCIGISSEKTSNFQQGLNRRNLTADDFEYTLALDPSRRMQSAVQARAIPHCIVMSSDWIVRWQGHPGSLDARTLGRIVKTNKAAVSGDHNIAIEAKRKRWTGG